MKFKLYLAILFIIISPFILNAQELRLFDLMYYETNNNENIAFISLSDIYTFSEHPDSLAVPDLTEIERDTAQNYDYFELKASFRTNFLSKTNISETDKVFVYDYSKNILKTFKVKDLVIKACLNIYGADWPYSQWDYMIGFEINKKYLTDIDTYFTNTLVYVGTQNPFIQNQLKPIVWKKIESKDYPAVPINPEEILKMRLYQGNEGNYYGYKSDSLAYYLQEFVGGNGVSARRLLVQRLDTKELVCDRILYDHESASPAPLTEQWTGKLFKNWPSVAFGFEYVSFGCPHIIVLDPTKNDIYINCDNRH